MIEDIGPVRGSREEEAAKAATVQAKETVRQTLERELEEFLARGGKVQEIGIIQREPEELTAVRVESHKRESAEARKLTPAERDARSRTSMRSEITAEVASKAKPAAPDRLQKIAEAAARKAAQPKPALPTPTPAAAAPAPKPEPVPEKKPMNTNTIHTMDPPQVAQKKPEAPNFGGKLTTAIASVFKPAVTPHTESHMERIRDVLFREIDLVQSGQSTFEQTARVLDLIDKIQQTYRTERELFPCVLQSTPQQDQQMKAALGTEPAKPKNNPCSNSHPEWVGREEIKSLVQRHGITGAEIVRAVGDGLSSAALSKYLMGVHNPRPPMANAIEKYVRERVASA